MSSKFNVGEIIFGHFKTLKDTGKNKVSIIDILSFYIFPVLVSIIGIYFCFNISKEMVSLLVNFGAIFTALLLSVLVLVYDQENKINQTDDDSLKTIKKNLLNQLYYNICYCIVISIVLVVVCLLHAVFNSIFVSINIYLITPLIIMVLMNLILTILMIVKRMHVLLVS